jgi:NlpC/P60 family putative phage cell wall peptidase
VLTRQQVIDQARTWLGTPYRHQGRLKGVAVDCVGLLVGVATELGVPATDMTGYTRRPDGQLVPNLYAQTEPVQPGQQQPGDIVVFHWRNDPVHLAILTGPNSIIHAFAINRKVCEHSMDERWLRQISAFRKIPGVE